MESTSSDFAGGAPAKGSGPGCCEGRTAVCCCEADVLEEDCAADAWEMARVTASAAVRVMSVRCMSDLPSKFAGLNGDSACWTRELYIRRARASENSASD